MEVTSKLDILPVELWSYIFILGATPSPEDPECSDAATQYELKPYVSPCMNYSHEFRDTASLVCTQWRQIVLATPQLWSKLSITLEDAMRAGDAEEVEPSQLRFPSLSRDLVRSGGYPIDILIDARDPDWDFTEFDLSDGEFPPMMIDELGNSYEYKHPFTVLHMQAVLAALLPHLSRWRSLAILVDRWAPMHAALHHLSYAMSEGSSGSRNVVVAPKLESLAFLRCNEFASYTPEFGPEEMMEPFYLPFGATLRSFESSNRDEGEFPSSPLPQLKHLTLSGVHVHWGMLPLLLPISPQPSQSVVGLRRLELSYHCAEVRGTMTDFRRLLQRCTMLEDLTIKVSGPHADSDDSDDESHLLVEDHEDPVTLPHLSAFAFGYDNLQAAIRLFNTAKFPQLRKMSLECLSQFVGDDEWDAGPLLEGCVRESSPGGNSTSSNAAFPSLEAVLLRNITSRWESFGIFFAAIPNLKALALRHTSACAVEGLQPQLRYTEGRDVPTLECPCPKLDTLLVRGEDEALLHSSGKMVEDRARFGAPIPNVHLEVPGSTLGDVDAESRFISLSLSSSSESGHAEVGAGLHYAETDNPTTQRFPISLSAEHRTDA